MSDDFEFGWDIPVQARFFTTDSGSTLTYSHTLIRNLEELTNLNTQHLTGFFQCCIFCTYVHHCKSATSDKFLLRSNTNTLEPDKYWPLESDKIEALKYSARNLDGPIHLHLAQTIYTSVANTSAHIHCTVGLSTST